MILCSRGPLLLLVHLLLLELDLLLKPHLMRLRCPRYPALAGLLHTLRLHLGLCLRLTALLLLFGLLGKVVNLPITLDIEYLLLLLLLVNEDSIWVGENLPLARPGRGSQFTLLPGSLRSDHPACVRSAGLLRHHLLLDGSCVGGGYLTD
jgi:hypothetical protein